MHRIFSRRLDERITLLLSLSNLFGLALNQAIQQIYLWEIVSLDMTKHDNLLLGRVSNSPISIHITKYDTNNFLDRGSSWSYFEWFQTLLWYFIEGLCLWSTQQCWQCIAFDVSKSVAGIKILRFGPTIRTFNTASLQLHLWIIRSLSGLNAHFDNMGLCTLPG